MGASGLRRKKLRGTNDGNWKENIPSAHLSGGLLCEKCGAWYGQLGLEPTINMYIEHLLEIIKELKRVLKPTGVMFWNHGDCYGGSQENRSNIGLRGKHLKEMHYKNVHRKITPKCLAGQNYRLLFRMIDEQGWIWRNQIIWWKCLGGNVSIYAKSNGKIIRTRVKDLAKLPLETLYLPTTNGWKKVLRIEKQPKRKLLTVHLRNGTRIEVTPEHRFLVNGKLIEARFLKKGMILDSECLPNEKGTQLGSYENGWVVGFWLAEGNYESDREAIRFSIHKNETEYANTLEKWSERYAGKYRKHIYKNCLTIIISGLVPTAIIKHYVSRSGAKHKRLSYNAFSENNEFLKGVLDGFLAGDGYYDRQNHRWRFRITANRDLVNDLRAVCNRLRYSMKARLRKGKGFGKEYLTFDIEIKKRKSGHHNEKNDHEILRIENTQGISYEIEIEVPHIFILPDGTLTHNSNHMPSSATDRFTNAYEPIFMLTKSKKYWFDLDAVRVPHKQESIERAKRGVSPNHKYANLPHYGGGGGINKPRPNIKHDIAVGRIGNFSYDDPLHTRPLHPLGKNPGDVWVIPTQPFPEAHFATFPEKLVEPMIKAGCPQWICKKYGKARERITEKKYKSKGDFSTSKRGSDGLSATMKRWGDGIEVYTLGWTDCGCNAGWNAGIVLDPFIGSGTTALVALRLGRRFIGIDINPKYCEMARKRIKPELNQLKLQI